MRVHCKSKKARLIIIKTGREVASELIKHLRQQNNWCEN